jgi:NAD(P)-dependent dehydrogenase (short-subunit alcohol dehydrogenase family)
MDRTLMGHFGGPSDLNRVLPSLLTPAAAFVTGVVIPVDGSISAHS